MLWGQWSWGWGRDWEEAELGQFCLSKSDGGVGLEEGVEKEEMMDGKEDSPRQENCQEGGGRGGGVVGWECVCLFLLHIRQLNLHRSSKGQ